MQTTHRIVRRARTAVENRLVLALEEARAKSIVQRTLEAPVRTGHLLIAPPGAGNIGDQAMVEAFVANVNGPVTIVVRRSGDVAKMPDALQDRATELVLPGLLYGLPHEHLRDLGRLTPLMAGARSLSVVGADIMDGAYWESPSVRRFRLARLGARMGLDTRILGFSWNAAPSRAARRAMVAASAETKLFARDPLSAGRLRKDGAKRVEDVADIALLTQPQPIGDSQLQAWIADRRSEGRRIVLLNANGLIESTSRMVDTFLALLSDPAAADCAFVAVPHVSRGTPTDVDLALELAARANDPTRVFAINRLLAPGQIASLAAAADLAVTGRMHLTVLATSVETPVVTVGYQGKVAGLYALLGTDTTIDGGLPAREGLHELVVRTLNDLPRLAQSVRAARPQLLSLSRKNIEGLGQVS